MLEAKTVCFLPHILFGGQYFHRATPMAAVGLLFSVAQLLLSHFPIAKAQPSYYEVSSETPISWINSFSAPYNQIYSNIGIRYILKKETSGPVSSHFACGFFQFFEGYIPTYQFGIILVVGGEPRVVWSANRSHKVRCKATLHLSSEGGLTLLDVDKTLVWSTNTTAKSVARLNLTETGNLVLFDSNNGIVWQSFDHPTDTLLLGQNLVPGQKLTASVSPANESESGLYSLSLTKTSLIALLESNPSQIYYEMKFSQSGEGRTLVRLSNGSFDFYGAYEKNVSVPLGSAVQHVRLDSDGHIRVYDWVGSRWQIVADVLEKLSVDDCHYPLVCGEYSICSSQGFRKGVGCSCPSNFKQISHQNANLGCSAITPFSCKMSQYHKLVKLENITHSPISTAYHATTTKECVQACLKNCSCIAALFYEESLECYLLPHVFSMVNNSTARNHFFVKVQAETNHRKKVALTIGESIGAFFGLLIIVTICVFLSRKDTEVFEINEEYLDHVPGMPRRYSFEDLMAVTGNFETRIGQGGFGSVFKGTLSDGTQVAVKLLDGLAQIKLSFLVEIKAIGNIHHLNLVRLVGFCAEKSHRLLVYEFMSNGSLDKWIFHGNPELALDWQTRRKIIFDIAKGLAYLHEECTQKILHLDIKPQNILLDENFNAKISDFGLSRLTDRDQSQVVTIMRGTPGYMAPEWLDSAITEKVDVYSFGVVVLEILCGRRNVDWSHPEKDLQLLSLFKIRAEDGQLFDLVDECCLNMQQNLVEVMKMMKVAAWCLQNDFAKRPCMSLVVKVLDGSAAVEDNLDYDFGNPPGKDMATAEPGHQEGIVNVVSTSLVPSELSAPR